MRKAMSSKVQEIVLVKSRRRCCLCFGLDHDVRIVQGQIAHVDRDASNSDPGNLAFLCLSHHEAYDSRTSQSKGITEMELRRYREELYAVMERAFIRPVVVGGRSVRITGDLSGRYAWTRENDQAELQVTVEGRLAKVSGMALHGATWPMGPNIGDLDFEAPIDQGRIQYREPDAGGGYSLDLVFVDRTIKATESNAFGRFGAGVSFAGTFALIE